MSIVRFYGGGSFKDVGRYLYKANYFNSEKFYRNGREVTIKGHPSIHMYQEAARIFLRVTDVRVERLHDITWLDALKGGCDQPMHFDKLWNSTIKKADRALYDWEADPWGWVVEFERISREEAEHNV